MSSRRSKIIKRNIRDRDVTKDRSKLKKRLAILVTVLAAIMYVFVLSLDLEKKQITEGPGNADIPSEKPSEPKVKPVDGGQLVISVSRFGSVDPYKNKERSMDDFFRLVYDSLFELDANYDLVPELAKGYSVEEEGKKIIVTLDPNARWHDGTSVTPADVAFTIDHIKRNPQSPYNHLIKNIAGTTSSARSITIDLVAPNALGVYDLTFPIISKDSIGSNAVLNDGTFGVIGNGMFRVVEYHKGKSIILRKNDRYHGAKPHINEVKALIYTDSTIRKNMFVAREVDLIESGYYELNKYDYEVFRTAKYQSRRFDFIAFNGGKAPFDQGINRRSIAKILDIRSAIEDAYRGEVRLSLLPISNGSELNLLRNSLYDKESVRTTELIGTVPERLKIITDKADPMKHRMAYRIKADLSLAGLDSDVIGLSLPELKEAVLAGNFDIGVFSYEVPLDKDITKLFKANEKLFQYDLEKIKRMMDPVYKQGNKTFQAQNYLLLQEELLITMPFVGIGFRNDYSAYNEKIYGELDSTSIEFYNGIEDLFILPKKAGS
ncbi:MAG: ABC transporter substrate-binding protein [Peptostreptococcaceae bacterium]|nr:ABC transporter substrate-binding protein [Peptostreptococcaceae bacterium]